MARPRAISLTARLALTYALLVGATLLVVLGLAVQLTRSLLSEALDDRLLAAVESFQRGPAGRVRQPEDLIVDAERWLQVSAFPGDQLVAVRGPDTDGDGQDDVLTNAGGVGIAEVAGATELLAARESRWADLEGPGGEVGRLAAAFDRMLARLEEAFVSQRRFLSDASHELRTPLTVVRGQLELLEDGLGSPEARRSLALATDELERMRRIVDDLLLLARLDEGLPLHRRPVEVDLVLREALLRGVLLARLDSTVEAQPELYVMADPERLLQVLTNLVVNAVRHAGADARLTLRGRREDGRVAMEVSDTGPGIPPEELPFVFDRLYRGSAARSQSAAGAGLGLSIVASLTRAMGGDVGVESEPGRGTTFRVWLPAADSVDTEPIPEI